jgi:hypothetical protein
MEEGNSWMTDVLASLEQPAKLRQLEVAGDLEENHAYVWENLDSAISRLQFGCTPGERQLILISNKILGQLYDHRGSSNISMNLFKEIQKTVGLQRVRLAGWR